MSLLGRVAMSPMRSTIIFPCPEWNSPAHQRYHVERHAKCAHLSRKGTCFTGSATPMRMAALLCTSLYVKGCVSLYVQRSLEYKLTTTDWYLSSDSNWLLFPRNLIELFSWLAVFSSKDKL
mmetsp:Transcript_1029/g.2189  ORF Transcript_1029/g.2189 Transcript_1029/m.2189 type:complete len:121 (+) Transcript_1029:2432-2794(+)